MKAVKRKFTLVAGCPTGDGAHTPIAHSIDRGKRQRYADAPGVTPKTRAAPSGSRANPSLVSSIVGSVDTRYLRNYEPAAVAVWEIATAAFSEAHFATFPPELAERCILAGCPVGGVVLDPFGGAGTVGLVADALGRDATLIELNPDYAAIAARRLKAGCVRVQGGDSRRGLAPLPLESL